MTYPRPDARQIIREDAENNDWNRASTGLQDIYSRNGAVVIFKWLDSEPTRLSGGVALFLDGALLKNDTSMTCMVSGREWLNEKGL